MDALGYALVHHYGIKPGDRVGIAMRNLPEWIVSFAAIISIGAVSVSLNSWWTEDELDYAINDSGLRVLIADTERVARAEAPCQRAGVNISRSFGRTFAPSAGRRTLERRGDQGRRDASRRDHPRDGRDHPLHRGHDRIPQGSGVHAPRGLSGVHGLFLECGHPSGSPGARRGRKWPDTVFRPHRAPLSRDWLCHRDDVLFFVALQTRDDVPMGAQRALQLIQRHQVTAFVGVPTQSWDMLESPNFSKYDTSSLTTVGGGGAPAPPRLVARVNLTRSPRSPVLGYGMTETNAYGPANSGDDYVTHASSTGRTPTIVMDVEIRDENLRVLPACESGEIWMKSPTLIRGYWQRPEATAETIQQGWLRTGDLGYIDEEGFLYIEDRLKDMILRAGENVYSAEVESAIYEHPSIHEAAVFGLPDERLGEEVACVIMLKHGKHLTKAELHAHLSSRLASFKVPTRVSFTDEPLPRNPAGKFLKREMPRIYFS